MSAGFAVGEERWRTGLGTLRQIVRQEIVARQIAAHLPDRPSRRVLDIGCGQGTQALALARRGHVVTGLDSSAQLLDDFRAALSTESAEVGGRVHLVPGDAQAIAYLFASSSFDAVLCHGVLMYFPDPDPLLDAIAQVVVPGGIVSLLVRNGDALAMRPGLLGDWDSVGEAFDGVSYRNRIGVDARADRLDDLTASLARRQMSVPNWYGVRVFTDTAASDAPLPEEATLDAILRFEERAGRTDPYRHVAALLHLIAVRSDGLGLGQMSEVPPPASQHWILLPHDSAYIPVRTTERVEPVPAPHAPLPSIWRRKRFLHFGTRSRPSSSR